MRRMVGSDATVINMRGQPDSALASRKAAQGPVMTARWRVVNSSLGVVEPDRVHDVEPAYTPLEA